MAQDFGWQPEGRLAFGVQDGTPLTVEKLDTGSADTFAVRFLVDGSARPAVAELKKQKLDHTSWHAEANEAGGVLVAILTPPSDFYARAGFHTLLRAAAGALAAQGLHPPKSCPLCGLEGCDALAYLSGERRLTHTACLENRLDVPEADTAPTRTPVGHVWSGLLGALLGAFIGGVFIWAVAMQSGKISWALYAFIPILSGLLYRTLRGRANLNLAGLSVFLASLLVALLLEQVWYQIVLSAEYGVNLPFSMTIPTYFRAHSLLSALRQMLTCLLALVAGFVAITIFLRRYAGEGRGSLETVRGARFIRRTARPVRVGAGGAITPKAPPEGETKTPTPGSEVGLANATPPDDHPPKEARP